MAFRKGKSGNPTGRPPGIRDRRSAFRELLEPHAKELVKKAVALARDGDVQALSLCISRLIPPARSAPVCLPAVEGPENLSQAVVDAMANGNIAIDDAQGMIGVLQAQAKIMETIDLERRISALETQNANASNSNSQA